MATGAAYGYAFAFANKVEEEEDANLPAPLKAAFKVHTYTHRAYCVYMRIVWRVTFHVVGTHAPFPPSSQHRLLPFPGAGLWLGAGARRAAAGGGGAGEGERMKIMMDHGKLLLIFCCIHGVIWVWPSARQWRFGVNDTDN